MIFLTINRSHDSEKPGMNRSKIEINELKSHKSSERERLINVEKGISYRDNFLDKNKHFLNSDKKHLLNPHNEAKVLVDSQGKLKPFEISPMKFDFLITEEADNGEPYKLSKSFEKLEPHPNANRPILKKLRGLIQGIIDKQKARRDLIKFWDIKLILLLKVLII